MVFGVMMAMMGMLPMIAMRIGSSSEVWGGPIRQAPGHEGIDGARLQLAIPFIVTTKRGGGCFRHIACSGAWPVVKQPLHRTFSSTKMSEGFLCIDYLVFSVCFW